MRQATREPRKDGNTTCASDDNSLPRLCDRRAANCLNNANITSVGQLAQKSEAEMLRYRNFGKKSLTEIKEKLGELGLTLGMKFDATLLEPLPGGVSMLRIPGFRREDDEGGDADSFSKLISANLGEDDEE